MSEGGTAVRGIVLGHGALADGFVDAVRRITGVGEEALAALSNKGLSPEMVKERLTAMVGDRPAVVFTDLPSGSCGFAARRLCSECGTVAVVSGVNLAMLLEFIMHRSDPMPALVARLVEKGRAAVCATPAAADGAGSHGPRAASG